MVVGTTNNEYPREAQDMSRALSHWYAQLRLDLDGMGPNDQPNLGTCKRIHIHMCACTFTFILQRQAQH